MKELKVSDFPTGTTVQIRRSELESWKGRHSLYPRRWDTLKGRVVGTGRGNNVYVVWEGTNSRQGILPEWIEIVKPSLKAAQAEEECDWKRDAGVWRSGCDGVFVFEDGGPTDNSFKFCPFCGNPIKESATFDGEAEALEDR